MEGPASGREKPRFRTPIPIFAWITAGLLLLSAMGLVVLRWVGMITPLNTEMLVLVISVPGAPVVIGLVGRAWSRARRRRREAALQVRRSRDVLQAVVEELPAGVVLVDRSHRVEMCNRHARQWLAGDAPPPGPLQCHRLLSRSSTACENDMGPCPIDRAIETRTTVTVEHPGRSAAGRDVTLQVQAVPIPDRSGGVGRVVLLIRDVTEQRRREALLERNRANAEAAGRAQSEFLANMSREIRDPVTTLLGLADLLVGTRAEDGGPLAEPLHGIQHCARRLLGMINDVLDLSRMEAGQFALEAREVSPADVVATVAGMMRPEAARRGDDLSVDYATALPRWILGDEARLRRVVTELVDNAVRFTENGRVRIVASFVPEWRDAAPAVRIRVIDTGVGLDEDDLPFLFEPFARPGVARGRTGLGLCLARRIAEMLGGELKATATAGKGAVFTLTVPTGITGRMEMVQPDPQQVPSPLAPQAGDDPEALAGVSVLVADDLPDHQRLIADLLEGAGAAVETTDSVAGGVARVRVRSFQAVVIDLQLPRADGVAAARALRAAGFDGPMIALTAHALAGDRKECLEAGCDEYLPKPVEPHRLVRVLAELVRQADGRAVRTVEPLRSEYADDPDLAGVLETFVAGLPTQIQAMREALSNAHHEELKRRAHQLKGAGGSYGYPTLTEVAGTLEQAARDRDMEAAQLALSALAELCRAIAAGKAAESSTKPADPPST